jgi:5-methylcytosine-specific restriction endonuclease McrA
VRPLTQKWDRPTRFDAKADAAKAAEANWKAVCKVVDARDKRECRVCGVRSNPNGTGLLDRGHRHHIVYRSAGGQDISSNLVTLCAACHNAEHKHQLRIEGNADDALTIWRLDDDGAWFISAQEVSPGVVLHD